MPERERPAVFREFFGREVLKYELERVPDIPFDVDLKFQALPGLTMMWGRAHGSRNQRTRETLTADATDDIGMIVNLSGPHRITHGQHEFVLGDGDATLVSMADVCSFTHRPPGDILALRVPPGAVRAARERRRRLLLAPNTERHAGAETADRLRQDRPGRARRSRAPTCSTLVVAHIYDLMAAAIGATRDAAEVAQGRGLRAARLQAIKEDIAGNLDQAGSVGRRARRPPRLHAALHPATVRGGGHDVHRIRAWPSGSPAPTAC